MGENKMKRLDARTYRASFKLLPKRVPESEEVASCSCGKKMKRLDARTYRASFKLLPKRVPESEEFASCSCEKNTSCSSYSVHQPSPGLKRASDFAADIPWEVYKRRPLMVENKMKRLDARTYRASFKLLPKRVPESEEVASCSCEKNTSCSNYSVHQPSPRLKRASDFAGDILWEVYKRRVPLRVEPLALSDFLSKLKKSSALEDEVSCSSSPCSPCSSCGSNEVDLVKLAFSQEAQSSPPNEGITSASTPASRKQEEFFKETKLT